MRPPPPTPKHVCRVLRDHEFFCIKMTGEEAVRSPPPAFPYPFGSADVDNIEVVIPPRSGLEAGHPLRVDRHQSHAGAIDLQNCGRQRRAIVQF